jgi:hypothetical protein
MDDREYKEKEEPKLTEFLTGCPEHLQPFAEAHARYEQTLAEALNEDRRAYDRVTLDYWVACNEAQNDPRKAREAYDNYQAALEKEQAAALERRRSSYRDYILALQSSWAGVDADRYDAQSLHMIGSSMQVVAAESMWSGTPVTPGKV